MTCDIVIRSYYRDFRWLRYCLTSIARFCVGFRRVVLVVPESSRERLAWRDLRGDVTIWCPDYADDYLGQQVTKLHADALTDADYVCHVDSDCVFERCTEPADLIDGEGRPRVRMAPYRVLDRHVPWKALTEGFLGMKVEYEFMRDPPYTFPRWIYPALRDYAWSRHGVSLESYILSRPPRGFSEQNALAAYAYGHHRDAFTWHDVAADSAPGPPCRAYWSWAGVDESTAHELDQLLR